MAPVFITALKVFQGLRLTILTFPVTHRSIFLGKEFGDKYSVSLTVLNLANRHLLIDNSLTFGGFHYDDPRQIYAEFRWHFHY